jgi:hypothetical protein
MLRIYPVVQGHRHARPPSGAPRKLTPQVAPRTRYLTPTSPLNLNFNPDSDPPPNLNFNPDSDPPSSFQRLQRRADLA